MKNLKIYERVGGLSNTILLNIEKFCRQFEPDTRICIEVSKHRFGRSIKQNKRYWAICKQIGEGLDHEAGVVHEHFKRRFLLTTKVDEITGEIYEHVGSSTRLNTKEFCDYCEKVENYAVELGVELKELEPAN